MQERNKGLIFVVAARLIMGMYGVLVKGIATSPLMLLFSMQLFGALLFFLYSIKARTFKMPLKYFGIVVLGTILILIADFSTFAAFKLLPIANAVFIKFLFPILILFLAPLFLKEKFHCYMAYAAILGFVGLGLILSQGFSASLDLRGIVYALISMTAVAFFIIVLKKILVYLPNETFMSYRYFISSVILLPIILRQESLPIISGITFLHLAGFGVLFAVLGSAIDIAGVRRLAAQDIGALMYVEPLAATLYGALFIQEIPAALTIIGGLLILVSGIMVAKHK